MCKSPLPLLLVPTAINDESGDGDTTFYLPGPKSIDFSGSFGLLHFHNFILPSTPTDTI